MAVVNMYRIWYYYVKELQYDVKALLVRCKGCRITVKACVTCLRIVYYCVNDV